MTAGVGLRRKRPKADAVERIGRIAEVAPMSAGIVLVVRPKVQIVAARQRIGHFTRGIATLLPAPIGALQIDLIEGVISPNDVPYQQTLRGDVAVVVRSFLLPILQEKKFLGTQGDFEHLAPRRYSL